MSNSNNDSKSSEDILGVDAKNEGLMHKPRMGLGSTDNENIALRRNHRELALLFRKQKMLGIEQEYVIKIIDLNSKSTQVNYRRLTRRVGRIRSHLTEEEIKEMENDVRKQEFANKYRNIFRNQTMNGSGGPTDVDNNKREHTGLTEELATGCPQLSTLVEKSEEREGPSYSPSSPTRETKSYNQTSQGNRPSSSRGNSKTGWNNRPKTAPNFGSKPAEEEDEGFGEIIPSLEGLLDQLHNIKPQQFYANQRKLKLYDIQLSLEELEGRKEALYRNVDAIINWDKKEEIIDEEEEKRKKEEEESKKPKKRKTTFMRSVLRNFSMELMMKTMQYGWADMGKCRYLRNRGGDDEDGSGANTLAKDTMKIQLSNQEPDESVPAARPRIEPGFGPDGKMIRTADLLGLKSYD